LGNGYSFRNLDASGYYLTVEHGVKDLAPVIASPYPTSWSVEPVDSEHKTWGYYRIIFEAS
jgi:hypothetical protein